MPLTRPYSEIPLATLVLATTFVETGCQNDGGGGLGEIGNLYLDFIEELNRGTEFYCECAVEAGYYDSVEMCFEPALPPPMVACIAGVFDDFNEVAPSLNCVMDAYTEFFACVEAQGCDGDTYACYDFLMATDACPEIPYAAQRALQLTCYGVTLPEPFTCADGQQIPETYQCDTEPDCDDGSDELNCPMFTCTDGTEIPLPDQCDFNTDCPDGSDEQNCPNTFTCDDGGVIPLSYQCDGYPDCADGTDELGC